MKRLVSILLCLMFLYDAIAFESDVSVEQERYTNISYQHVSDSVNENNSGFDTIWSLIPFTMDSISGNDISNWRLSEDTTDLSDYHRRKQITDFIEMFRSAFNRHDIEPFREKMSDCLMVTNPSSEEETQFLQIAKLDNESFLQRLEKYYSIGLSHMSVDSITITRHPIHQDIYGVRLHVVISGDRYTDDGYFFIAIDFADDDCRIQIIGWQPYVPTMEKHDLFSLSDFDF